MIFNPDRKHIEIIAYEAFLRRAASTDLPFMLKGSYLTRQYFANPEDRIPNDIDWVYINGRLDHKEEAVASFEKWVTDISELHGNDGVKFRSFRENPFWRQIDYAMDDDFPTTSTDLDCEVDGETGPPCRIDISFNLPINIDGVFLQYKPLRGTAFNIENTAPLALQVSWKLHQTLVRPRYKDLFDLMHLVIHPAFTADTLQITLRELERECALDNTDPLRLNYLLNGGWDELFYQNSSARTWEIWRHGQLHLLEGYDVYNDIAIEITNPDKLPETLTEFKELFSAAFRRAGFYSVDFNQVFGLGLL
ncbi:hypothetical protein HHL16_11010 [Pseudoflavitalea sp. G-6-1-2]|uniref:nucleotidyl transferase AbiEii/AbiGii toxin family protein n=1 Tax=Pseudoflavitalea sp. G-6-1-2 TaxID=2728841 RepID=UPI00146B2C6F|nr:nucleotidyl transferase AbiEii/AbiGii toxin family protein [Pseudoflavitalea sp. G-6-1-2]NML21407.1 hypothetical protein [Pseudoflavitalea sp. G-6-1-2]